jgi:hypothetical protein
MIDLGANMIVHGIGLGNCHYVRRSGNPIIRQCSFCQIRLSERKEPTLLPVRESRRENLAIIASSPGKRGNRQSALLL